jgi:hypothetical protein
MVRSGRSSKPTVVRLVGIEGLTYLVARRALFVETPLAGVMAYKSAEAVVADASSCAD